MIHLLYERGMNPNIYKKSNPSGDQKQDIKEQTNTFDADSVLNELGSELQEYFEKRGYSVEVGQYKNIVGNGIHISLSPKKKPRCVEVISIFYNEDHFNVAYKRMVKFFNTADEVKRYVCGLNIVCESKRRMKESNYPDGFDISFRYMDNIYKSRSNDLTNFIRTLGDRVVKFRLDNGKADDTVRLAAKSDLNTWFKILEYLRNNDCYAPTKKPRWMRDEID